MTDVFNLLETELDDDPRAGREGHRFRRTMVGRLLGSSLTGLSVYEVPPGEAVWAYHYELHREEWLIVVSGEVVVRTPGGDERLAAGDIVCFPTGAEGAHAVRNDSSEPARFAMPSTRPRDGYVAVRPDSNTAFVVGPGFEQIVPLDESLDYWDREP